MKRCITCGISSDKAGKFRDSQCDECEARGKVILEYVPPPIIKLDFTPEMEAQLMSRKRKREVCRKCGMPETEFDMFKYVSGNRWSVHERCYIRKWNSRQDTKVRLCGCGNKLIRYRKKCDSCNVIICKECLFPETDSNPFFKDKLGKSWRIHVGCRTKKQKEVKVKVKPSKVTPLDRFLAWPDKQVCIKCNIEKPVSDFYHYNKTFYLYHNCKKCHLEMTEAWKLQHREEHLAYLRNYHKNYDKLAPKRNKLKLLFPIILQP